jgi:hypothetical protein
MSSMPKVIFRTGESSKLAAAVGVSSNRVSLDSEFTKKGMKD